MDAASRVRGVPPLAVEEEMPRSTSVEVMLMLGWHRADSAVLWAGAAWLCWAHVLWTPPLLCPLGRGCAQVLAVDAVAAQSPASAASGAPQQLWLRAHDPRLHIKPDCQLHAYRACA